MSDRDDSDHSREQEQEHGHEYVARKKRTRACDRCRRRKIRCDGSEEQGKSCSTCVSLQQICTWTQSAEQRKKRLVDTEEYIKSLEAEVAKLRLLVVELQTKLDEKKSTSPPSSMVGSPISSPYTRHSSDAEDLLVKQYDTTDETLLEGFRAMNITDNRHFRFLGRSSHFPLMKAAFDMKREFNADNANAQVGGGNAVAVNMPHRRQQFWLHVFDFLPRDPPYTDFPEPTLLNELIDNYFRTIHYELPLLHEPSFRHGLASGLHREDEGFGAIVLLVCALGARFSNNPATLPPDAQSWQLAGWQWFDQVRSMRRLMPMNTTTPADVQVAALAAAYVSTLALQYTNSSLIGHGLRIAQDLGVHRRMTYGAMSPLEGEMRKRAFWCLIVMDRGMSVCLGRPCSIQEEDFDLDYPLEVDDEYWLAQDPQNAFKQPPGKPSYVSHLNWYLKLTEISARALRTLYSLQASKLLEDPDNAQQLVADFDSELNNWLASLPEHLKYDPTREDVPFAVQAASLQAAYHNLRIFIHRPFITMPREVPLPIPSLMICTNAARSCIQVLERYFALAGPVHIYQYHIGSMFQAALILLLHTWQKMRAGIAIDVSTEFMHVNKALRVFSSLETYWDVAGRSWDILRDMLSVVQARHQQLARTTSPQQASSSTSFEPSVLSLPTDALLAEGYSPSTYRGPPAGFAPPAPPTVAQTAPAQAGSWYPSLAPAAPTAGQSDFALAQQSADPDLDAIFADLLPTLGYDSAGGMQPYFGAGPLFDAGATEGVSGMFGGGFGSGWDPRLGGGAA